MPSSMAPGMTALNSPAIDADLVVATDERRQIGLASRCAERSSSGAAARQAIRRGFEACRRRLRSMRVASAIVVAFGPGGVDEWPSPGRLGWSAEAPNRYQRDRLRRELHPKILAKAGTGILRSVAGRCAAVMGRSGGLIGAVATSGRRAADHERLSGPDLDTGWRLRSASRLRRLLLPPFLEPRRPRARPLRGSRRLDRRSFDAPAGDSCRRWADGDQQEHRQQALQGDRERWALPRGRCRRVALPLLDATTSASARAADSLCRRR